MMTIRFVISLIFAVIIAIFALQNATNVTFRFLFAEFAISQALIILISAVFGAIMVLILGTIKQIKTNIKIKNLTKLTNKLEEENRILKGQIEENEKIQDNGIDNKVLEVNIDHENQTI